MNWYQDFEKINTQENWHALVAKQFDERTYSNLIESSSLEGIKINALGDEKFSYNLNLLSTSNQVRGHFARTLEELNLIQSLEQSKDVKRILCRHALGEFKDFNKVFAANSYNLKTSMNECEQNAIFLDSGLIHEAGGSVVQEIAYLYSLAFLFQLTQNKEKLILAVACDCQLFINIAKIRALRYLLQNLFGSSKSNFEILAYSSRRHLTYFDESTNLLRNTTAAMAGIFAGADIVCVAPFNELTFSGDEQSKRTKGCHLALNTLEVLMGESELEKVNDPFKGSQSIEQMSYDIAMTAHTLALNWEDNQKGIYNMQDFDAEVKILAKKRWEKLRMRKKIIPGINDFAAPNEQIQVKELLIKEEVKFSRPFPVRRDAFEFERLRIDFPKVEVNLYVKGEVSKLSARINFCKNIFALVGLEANERIYQSADFSNSRSIDVIIAQDLDYPDLIKNYHSKTQNIFLAGPKIEGVKNNIIFLHLGMNVYEFLNSIKLGLL